MITPDEVRLRVAGLKDLDDESAHAGEDTLHQDVLRAIAAGADNSQELAAEALRSVELKFCRWYA